MSAAPRERLDSNPAVRLAWTRCPFCHQDVEVAEEDWVACAGCLARHHRACWDEVPHCASCGHDARVERLPGVAKLGAPAAPRRRASAQLVLALLALLVAPSGLLVAWLPSGSEPDQVVLPDWVEVAVERVREAESKRAAPTPSPASTRPPPATTSPREQPVENPSASTAAQRAEVKELARQIWRLRLELRGLRAQSELERATRDGVSGNRRVEIAVQALLNQGVRCLMDENPREAQNHFLAGLQLQAGHPETLSWLGLSRLHLGEVRAALGDFDEALLRDPSLRVARLHRAEALRRLGRLTEAEQDLIEVVRLAWDDVALRARASVELFQLRDQIALLGRGS